MTLNRAICLARSAWYGVSEPVKLSLVREVCRQADPLVSVIVPTFNRKALLIERCLKSILAQTYKNFELIVVAHGCTDGTLIAVLGLRDPRIRVVAIPREQTYPPTLENHWFAGRVAASNVGLAHCTGKWTATIDDDDAWTPDHIEVLLRFAQTHNYEFVSGASVRPDGAIPPYDLGGMKIGGIATWLFRSYLNSFRFNPDCWRRETDRVCDTELQARFVRAGVKIGYLDKIVTRILPRPGETSTGLKAARENKESYMSRLSFK